LHPIECIIIVGGGDGWS
jgi:hypothetical protein